MNDKEGKQIKEAQTYPCPSCGKELLKGESCPNCDE